MTTTNGDAVLVLEGPAGFGRSVEGEVLLASDGFSPRYDLDRATGEISRRGHSAKGHNIKGKILVIGATKGGVAAGWALYDLKCRELAPAALVCRTTNTVFVQGCVLAGIPIVHRLEPDAVTALRSGDRVRVEPQQGRVVVLQVRADRRPGLEAG